MSAFFVHIGDCHMGPNARNADRWRALDQIINENLDRADLAAWLIPGDLNHARMTIEDRNAWAERLRLMAGKAPIIICYGNHDLPGDLDVFARLASKWPISVVSTPQVLTVVGPAATFSVFVLPYPTEAGLVSAGVAPGDMVPTAREALDVIFMSAAAQLEDARRRGEIALAVGHVNVAGSITSVGQPNIGQEIEIDSAMLARLGDGYTGLNHIHKSQDIAGASYPGSICRLDWGEIEAKGYLTVEYADADAHLVTLPLIQWHGLDVPAMYHVDGHLHRDRFDYRVTAGPDGATVDPPQTWTGCEVRVRARFYQSEKDLLELSRAQIFANFAEASRFELELIAVPDRALRAPEVAAAKTLTDKVAAWASVTLTILPDQVLPFVPALEHGDPDTLLAQVQERVSALVSPTTTVEAREEAVA